MHLWAKNFHNRYNEWVYDDSDGSGSKIFDLGRVGSDQPPLVWVWVWKISPKNVKFFNFFSIVSKKISSGQVKKYLGQRLVGLLFTAGLK